MQFNQFCRKSRVAWDLVRLAYSQRGDGASHLGRLLRSVCTSGIPTVPLAEFLQRLEAISGADARRITIHPLLRGGGSGSVGEMAALSSLVAARRPKTVLEFGTYDGCSTWHLWANSPDDARIITLDLPAGVKVEGSTDSSLQGVSERVFLPKSPRIELIEIDSREWTPDIRGGVDLCFIDAGHTYECSRNDTEKALSVMNKNGLIVWHDAAWRSDGYGVNRHLRQLRGEGRDVRIIDLGPYDYCALAAMIV